ncbi:MAG: hypothetical protein ACYC6Y_02535 [Thermoguttaceae bacterium]
MSSAARAGRTEGGDLVILCVGRANRLEFREVLPALERWGRVIAAAGVGEALSRLACEGSIPDVIVVAQSYPGEFADSQIDGLRRVAPLARFVAVLGSWCEGEMRSGSPWSGAVRVFWHQWLPHCHRELERLLAGRESLWSLPPTAGEEERCLVLASRRDRPGLAARPALPPAEAPPVEIVTRQYEVFQWLAAACADRGFQARWRRDPAEPPAGPTAVVLFDAAEDTDLELARFRRIRSGGHVSAIVLADFPRAGDRDRFVAAGAKAVVSRPFFWDDLFGHFPAAEDVASKNGDRSATVGE